MSASCCRPHRPLSGGPSVASSPTHPSIAVSVDLPAIATSCHVRLHSGRSISSPRRLGLWVMPVPPRVCVSAVTANEPAGACPWAQRATGLGTVRFLGHGSGSSVCELGPRGLCFTVCQLWGFLFVFRRPLSLEGFEEPKGWESGAGTEVWLVSEKRQPVGRAEGDGT